MKRVSDPSLLKKIILSIKNKYIIVKTIFPFLGEANIYKVEDLKFFEKCVNTFELERDPLLRRIIKYNNIQNKNVVEKIVYIVRMLESDFYNLSFRFDLRRNKWNFHLNQIFGHDLDFYNIKCLDDLLLIFDKNIFKKIDKLRIKEFLVFYFENKNKKLGFIYEFSQFNIEYMVLFPHHWSGYARESRNMGSDILQIIKHPDIYKKIMLRQLDWEVWGLSSQYLMNVSKSIKDTHYLNLRSTLIEMRVLKISGLEDTISSLYLLERRSSDWINNF